jgi:hypothetical protein
VSSAHRGQPSGWPSRILSRCRGLAVRPPIAASPPACRRASSAVVAVGLPPSLLCRRRGLPPSASASSACCALHRRLLRLKGHGSESASSSFLRRPLAAPYALHAARAADLDLCHRRFCVVRLLRHASSASVPSAAWDKGRGSGSASSLLPPEICADRRRCGQGRGSAAPAGNLRRNLRQLVQVGLLSATAPLVCLVSGLLFSLIFIEFNIATNAFVVNITLNGQNYPEWAFCVETALKGHGLLFHLTDAAPVLADGHRNAADIKTWQLNDGKVMAAMVNNVKPSMIISLSKFKTAKAIWSHLKERFVQDNGALLHTLMQQTHVIEQNDMSIDEYYSTFDRLMSASTSMVPTCNADTCPAHKFIEKFFTYRHVMDVRAKFDSLCARLL